jgi:two-component system response regulator
MRREVRCADGARHHFRVEWRGRIVTARPFPVLVVDDNADDRDLTLSALRGAIADDSVHIARDGAEALEYLFRTGRYAARRPDDDPRLVLLDLRMPVLDGLEVLKRMRADERLRPVPVLMLTASTNDNDILNSFKLGIAGYLVKGTDFAAFSRTVQAAVASAVGAKSSD